MVLLRSCLRLAAPALRQRQPALATFSMMLPPAGRAVRLKHVLQWHAVMVWLISHGPSHRA